MTFSQDMITLRSQPMAAGQIDRLISRVESIRSLDVLSFRQPEEPPNFLTVQLPSLACLGNCVAINVHTTGTINALRTLAKRLEDNVIGVSITWNSKSSVISALKSNKGVSRGLHLRNMSGKVERAEWFKKAVETMGLSDFISVSLEGQALLMSASEPYTLEYSAAEIGGKNPYGFRVNGPERLETAIQSSLALVDTFEPLGAFVVRLNASLTPQQYETHREALNVASPWEADVAGCLDEAAVDVLYDRQTTTDATPFIPAFSVSDRRDRECCCALVRENGKQFFEFSSVDEDFLRRVTELSEIELMGAYPSRE